MFHSTKTPRMHYFQTNPPEIQVYEDEGTNHHLFPPRILSLPRSPQGTVSIPPSPHAMLFRFVLVHATIPRATYPFDVLPPGLLFLFVSSCFLVPQVFQETLFPFSMIPVHPLHVVLQFDTVCMCGILAICLFPPSLRFLDDDLLRSCSSYC